MQVQTNKARALKSLKRLFIITIFFGITACSSLSGHDLPDRSSDTAYNRIKLDINSSHNGVAERVWIDRFQGQSGNKNDSYHMYSTTRSSQSMTLLTVPSWILAFATFGIIPTEDGQTWVTEATFTKGQQRNKEDQTHIDQIQHEIDVACLSWRPLMPLELVVKAIGLPFMIMPMLAGDRKMIKQYEKFDWWELHSECSVNSFAEAEEKVYFEIFDEADKRYIFD